MANDSVKYEAVMIIDHAETVADLRARSLARLHLRTPAPVKGARSELQGASAVLEGVDLSHFLVGRFERMRARVTIEIEVVGSED